MPAWPQPSPGLCCRCPPPRHTHTHHPGSGCSLAASHPILSQMAPLGCLCLCAEAPKAAFDFSARPTGQLHSPLQAESSTVSELGAKKGPTVGAWVQCIWQLAWNLGTSLAWWPIGSEVRSSLCGSKTFRASWTQRVKVYIKGNSFIETNLRQVLKSNAVEFPYTMLQNLKELIVLC